MQWNIGNDAHTSNLKACPRVPHSWLSVGGIRSPKSSSHLLSSSPSPLSFRPRSFTFRDDTAAPLLRNKSGVFTAGDELTWRGPRSGELEIWTANKTFAGLHQVQQRRCHQNATSEQSKVG